MLTRMKHHRNVLLGGALMCFIMELFFIGELQKFDLLELLRKY